MEQRYSLLGTENYLEVSSNVISAACTNKDGGYVTNRGIYINVKIFMMRQL